MGRSLTLTITYQRILIPRAKPPSDYPYKKNSELLRNNSCLSAILSPAMGYSIGIGYWKRWENVFLGSVK